MRVATKRARKERREEIRRSADQVFKMWSMGSFLLTAGDLRLLSSSAHLWVNTLKSETTCVRTRL